jgi:hypothetical protein
MAEYLRIVYMCMHGNGSLCPYWSHGQEARILSLAWHKGGAVLVAGAADSKIMKFNVKTGRSALRITVEDIHKESTLVWAVAVLSDMTIVSGDSLGNTNVWAKPWPGRERGTSACFGLLLSEELYCLLHIVLGGICAYIIAGNIEYRGVRNQDRG